MKKIYMYIVFFIVVGFLLTACKSVFLDKLEYRNNKSSDKKERVANLTFWTFKKEHLSFMKNSVDGWNDRDEEANIILDGKLLGYDELHEKLYTSLKSGFEYPDFVDIELSKFSYYIKEEIYFESLNKLIEANYENFLKSRLENYSKDGHYYGIDYYTGATFIFYNKEITDKSKVNLDKIETWSDFVLAGKKVLYKTKRPMITFSVSDIWSYYPILKQQNSDILNDAGAINLNGDKSINTLEFMHNLIYKEKIAIPAPGGNHYSDQYFNFMDRGGAASVMMPSWYMKVLEENMENLEGKVVIKPMPRWDENSSKSVAMGGIATSVIKRSPEKDLALDFLNYAKISKEGCKRIWSELKYDPVRWDVFKELDENNLNHYFANDITENFESVKYDIESVNNMSGYDRAIDILEDDVLSKVLYENSVSSKGAMQSAVDKFESYKE